MREWRLVPIGTYIKATAIGLAFCFVYGLVVGVFFLIPGLIVGKLPQWSWWQCLLAPLSIGIVAVAGEFLVEPLRRRGQERAGQVSRWRKAGHICGVIALLAGFMVFWKVVL